LRRGCAFVRQIDKLPLPVRSAPGFLVNAVLGPYLYAAIQAVEQGLPPESVDAAMLAFGMPMGPIELVDLVGLDVALAAGKSLDDAAGRKALWERLQFALDGEPDPWFEHDKARLDLRQFEALPLPVMTPAGQAVHTIATETAA
jgi:3-hydroxyacyl-CoA dehydrogenase/enoyl-CoA hydratase/3-hydroxybutyryl-CoA epimerase